MTDDRPEKKTGTLKLKARANASDAPTTASDKPRASQKSGARAHQKARQATEQQKRQAAKAQPVREQPKPTRHRPPETNEVFDLFAPCPRGLQQALAEELNTLGFLGVQAANAGCHFRGNWHEVWRANLHSRLATRILVRLSHGPIRNESDLRELASQTTWERWFTPEKTLRVDTSAIRSPMKSLQFCNLLVKDSICDRLRERQGARPSIDTVRPDVRVHSFLSADSATLYLDTSGESLFKRGWRFDKAEAPIRENLAAGLLALSNWQPHQPLLDPFCGSGTILIEAAWIALNIAPGINRPFAFERLSVHEAPAWQALRRQASEAILSELPAPIMGSDRSLQAIEAARANMHRAGLLPRHIELSVADAQTVTPTSDAGMIVTNPPYGERLALDDDLMLAWAAQLKRQFAHWQVNVISADHGLPGAMRLKPRRKVPVFNGAIDCRMFIFDMVNEHYDATKKQQ
jgi:putative N6-adenine-specific DNA methylase